MINVFARAIKDLKVKFAMKPVKIVLFLVLITISNSTNVKIQVRWLAFICQTPLSNAIATALTHNFMVKYVTSLSCVLTLQIVQNVMSTNPSLTAQSVKRGLI